MIDYLTLLIFIFILILVIYIIYNLVSIINNITANLVMKLSKYCRQSNKVKKIKTKNNKKK